MPDHRSDGSKHTDVHGDALVGCARPPLCRPHPWPIDLRQGRTATTPSVPSSVITRVPVKAGPGGGIAEGAGRHDRKGPPGPDPMLTMSKNGRESLQRSMAGLAMPVSRKDGANFAPRRQDRHPVWLTNLAGLTVKMVEAFVRSARTFQMYRA